MTPATAPAALDAALSYADRGLRVLVLHGVRDGRCTCGRPDCGSPGKHPRTPHGVKNATTDHAIIRAWFQQWPNANIGIATGTGMLVLDADGAEGVENLKALGVPATSWLARTGGGGLHLWLGSPNGAVANRVALLPGLDVRGDGGYVVAPPSLHASGRLYEWLTSPNGMAIAPASKAVRMLLAGGNGHAMPEAGTSSIPEGQRNSSLYRLGRSLAAKGLSPDAIQAALDAENQARCVPPLSGAEVVAIAEHVMAQPHAPAFKVLTPEEATKYAGSRKRRSAIQTPPTNAAGRGKRAVVQKLSDVEFQPVTYLWPQRVPRGKLVVLMGDPGLGKSLLTLDIAARISVGAPWPDGGAAPKGNVVVLSAEDDPADTIRPRLFVLDGDARRGRSAESDHRGRQQPAL